MSKRVYKITSIVLCVVIGVLLFSLINERNKVKAYKEVMNMGPDVEYSQDDRVEIKPQEIKDRSDQYTLVNSRTWDIDRDGKEERIELYVDAELGEDGSYVFDCGQNWLALVKYENTEYVLYEGHIQHGLLELRVYEVQEGYEFTFHVSTVLDSTTSFSVEEYAKVKDKDIFIKSNSMSRSSLNYIGTISIHE